MSDLITAYKFTPQIVTTPIDLDDVEMIKINVGSEIKNDNMVVTLKNASVNTFTDQGIKHRWVDENGLIMFKAVRTTPGTTIDEEIVEVYATYTETDPSISAYSPEYLLFSGVINKGKITYTTDTTPIEITCLNRSSVILDKLSIPQSYPASASWTSPLVIKQIIRQGGSTGSKNNFTGFDYSGNSLKGYPFLVDARLFSEGIKSSGTITSSSSRKLIDSTADFTTDAIEVGDWVRTTLNQEYAYVRAIDSSTQLSLSKDIFTASGEGYEISNGFIQDTRPDGTTFPIISYSDFNKPITESVQKLSQIDFTNSVDETNTVSGSLVVRRGCRWFIDTRNRFHWYVPSDTPDHIIEIGASAAVAPDSNNHLIHELEIDNEVRARVNFIIFKAGEDMNGLMISSFARQPFSGLPITKQALRQWLHISRTMKTEDERVGNIAKTSSDTYAYPTSYPVTPKWDRQLRSVASNSAYNANFIEEATIRGRALAQGIFQQIADPRWSGNMRCRGEAFQVGDLISVTSRVHGIFSILMRINQVGHTIDPKNGWITNVSFEEDEKLVQLGLV